MSFLTLDDVDVAGKRVFLRVDINSPIDKEKGLILDDRRIRAILPTLDDLRRAKVVLTSHQGRPGGVDFSSLAPHVKVLRKYCKRTVKFVEDVMGPAAIRAIKRLRDGEILVLENVRFCSEELVEASPEKLSKTYLVQRLAPHFDLFINDAFAAAHRSQPSLVGFAEVLPTMAGRVMERELRALDRVIKEAKRPVVIILGGVKVEDRVPVIRTLLEREVVDLALVGGMVGNIFLKAKGYDLGKETEASLKEEYVKDAKSTLAKFEENVIIPADVAWRENGKRIEKPVDVLENPSLLLDIGEKTAELFSNIIKEVGTIVMIGPLGRYEVQGFDRGTRKVLLTASRSKAFTVVGGGHLIHVVRKMGIEKRIEHISTGGGALLYALSGREMPVIEALKRAALRRCRN